MEENKYEAALERAKSAIKECGDNVGRIKMIESIFPELKEPDDERIRKDITILVKNWWDRVATNNMSSREEMLAWLEKQGKMDEKQGWHNELEKAYEWLDNNFRVSSFDSTKIVTDFSNMYDLKDSFKKAIKNRL